MKHTGKKKSNGRHKSNDVKITSNVTGLNNIRLDKKTRFNYILPTGDTLCIKRYKQTESKRAEKYISCKHRP